MGMTMIRIGFAKEQCFQFGVKALWRDGKGRGLSELVGWVRYLSQCWRKFVPERRDSYSYGAIGKFEGRGDRRESAHIDLHTKTLKLVDIEISRKTLLCFAWLVLCLAVNYNTRFSGLTNT